MKKQEILRLSAITDQEAKRNFAFSLFQFIDNIHSQNNALASFSWRNLEIDETGAPVVNVETTLPSSEVLILRNYHDYAGIIYTLATGDIDSEAMGWNAGRNVDDDILREIILTFCGRNESMDPLIDRLRAGYSDEDSFFDGYTTIAEHDATEAYERDKSIHAVNDIEQFNCEAHEHYKENSLYAVPKTSWFKENWVYLLCGAIIMSLLRACANI